MALVVAMLVATTRRARRRHHVRQLPRLVLLLRPLQPLGRPAALTTWMTTFRSST
jgi:hypothetical protein